MPQEDRGVHTQDNQSKTAGEEAEKTQGEDIRHTQDDEPQRVTCSSTKGKKRACDRGVSFVIPHWAYAKTGLQPNSVAIVSRVCLIVKSHQEDADDSFSCDDVIQRWVSHVPTSQKGDDHCAATTPNVAYPPQRRNRNFVVRCHSPSLSDRTALCKNNCSSMASAFTYLNTAELDHSPAKSIAPSVSPWAAISVARPALKAFRVNFCEFSTKESDRSLRSVDVHVPVVKRKSGCPAER